MSSRPSVFGDIAERQASDFAMELLMPAPWLRQEAPTEGFDVLDGSIDRLATRYGVDAPVMTLRLRRLGLLMGQVRV